MHAASHQVHSQPPGASRGPVIRGVRRSRLESRAWKVIPDLGLPGQGGPSPGGGDLVPESQSGGTQVGTAQELLESGSRASSWQRREGEEVTDGRGCSSQPPPARGSQDDLVYQCPRKGGGQGVGRTGRAWGVVEDGTLCRSSSSPHSRDLIPTGAPPLSMHRNPP